MSEREREVEGSSSVLRIDAIDEYSRAVEIAQQRLSTDPSSARCVTMHDVDGAVADTISSTSTSFQALQRASFHERMLLCAIVEEQRISSCRKSARISSAAGGGGGGGGGGSEAGTELGKAFAQYEHLLLRYHDKFPEAARTMPSFSQLARVGQRLAQQGLISSSTTECRYCGCCCCC